MLIVDPHTGIARPYPSAKDADESLDVPFFRLTVELDGETYSRLLSDSVAHGISLQQCAERRLRLQAATLAAFAEMQSYLAVLGKEVARLSQAVEARASSLRSWASTRVPELLQDLQ